MHPRVKQVVDSIPTRYRIYTEYLQNHKFRDCIDSIITSIEIEKDGFCAALKASTGEGCTNRPLPGKRFCGLHGQAWRYVKGKITAEQVLKRQRQSENARIRQVLEKGGGKITPDERAYLAYHCGNKCCPLKDLPDSLARFRPREEECKYFMCNPPPANKEGEPFCDPSCDKILAKIFLKNIHRKKKRQKIGTPLLPPQQQQFFQYLGNTLDRAYKENDCSTKLKK